MEIIKDYATAVAKMTADKTAGTLVTRSPLAFPTDLGKRYAGKNKRLSGKVVDYFRGISNSERNKGKAYYGVIIDIEGRKIGLLNPSPNQDELPPMGSEVSFKVEEDSIQLNGKETTVYRAVDTEVEQVTERVNVG